MQHRTGTSCAILSLTLVTTLGAQTTKVVPAANARVEGSASSPFPFGYTNPRVQQIWSGSAVTTGTALINGISFRLDGSNRQPAVTSRAYTNITIAVGTTTTWPKNMSTTFASNVTSSLTRVVRGAYSLRKQPAPTASPTPFNIHFRWAQNYVFAARKGNLLLDMTFPGQMGKSNYFVDAEVFSGGAPGAVTPFGKSGAFASPEVFALKADAASLTPGGALEVTCGPFRKSYPGQLVLGLSNKRFAGVNLPLNLGVIGAPNNNLYVSMDVRVGFNTIRHSIGSESAFRGVIPRTSIHQGLTFYTQAYYVDPLANGAGIVVTNALALRIAGASGPQTNVVGHPDATQKIGWFSFGSGRYGGPVARFSGVWP